MAMDFSGAPTDQGGSLIPDGTLSWAHIFIRAKAPEFGKILNEGKDNPQNKYLDCQIVLEGGNYHDRKVFQLLGVKGSETWVNMSMAAIRHILEVGKNAGPGNPQGYSIGVNLADDDERMWMELDGLKCAVKVEVEPGKDGYKDKNRVKFLSPNPDSSTSKDFAALVAGATTSTAPARTAKAPSADAKPSWAPNTGSAPAPSTAAGTPPVRPSWTGTPPPQGTSTVSAQPGVVQGQAGSGKPPF